MIKKPPVNNSIRASQVRLIDETGKQLGVVSTFEALKLAKERGLDLIQVTEKLDPPVCKLGDYGKYLYHEEKKHKVVKSGGEFKIIRLSFNISIHDMEVKAGQAEKFLSKGDKVGIELPLRGREKALGDFAKEKMSKFVEIVKVATPIKIERDIKREGRGLTMIISKG